MKIGFSIDDLPSNYITYRKKNAMALHHRAGLHYSINFYSSVIPTIHNFIIWCCKSPLWCKSPNGTYSQHHIFCKN